MISILLLICIIFVNSAIFWLQVAPVSVSELDLNLQLFFTFLVPLTTARPVKLRGKLLSLVVILTVNPRSLTEH